MSAVQTHSLETLRDRANSEHRLVAQAANEMIAHAIRAGQALNEARKIVPHGGWMEWVEREFAGSLSNANFYRRLALNAELVTASGARTLREAERWMVDHAALTTPVPRTGEIVKQRRAEILKLRDTGASIVEVAEIVGVSPSTVTNLTRKDWQRVHRRRNLKRKQATQALQREQRDKAARRVGGEVAEAYALVRRTAATIERAMENTNGQSKQHLARALDRLYRCEDELSRAIRTAVESQ